MRLLAYTDDVRVEHLVSPEQMRTLTGLLIAGGIVLVLIVVIIIVIRPARRCPMCMKGIHPKATICPFCRSAISGAEKR